MHHCQIPARLFAISDSYQREVEVVHGIGNRLPEAAYANRRTTAHAHRSPVLALTPNGARRPRPALPFNASFRIPPIAVADSEQPSRELIALLSAPPPALGVLLQQFGILTAPRTHWSPSAPGTSPVGSSAAPGSRPPATPPRSSIRTASRVRARAPPRRPACPCRETRCRC